MSAERYFEDYVAGTTAECGSVTLSEAEIVDFAGRFDRQKIHTDPEAAKRGPFSGLIASGWHTAAVTMSMVIDTAYISDASSIASPGVDELRWLRPVRPGDTLRVRLTVMETIRSKSKPDRGMVRTFMEVLNQADDVVMSLKAMNMIRCRSEA